MNWIIKSFQQLTSQELYAILALRNEVFIVEQNCPYQDIDGKDQASYHLMGYQDDCLIGYCRLVKENISYPEASIGRVVVTESYRQHHLGKTMLLKALAYMKEELHYTSIRISAQYYLLSFYQSLGFKECSEVYLEDDIEHIEMLIKL